MKITIIGAGAMGGAMAEGLLQSEKFTPSDITVSDLFKIELSYI